MTEIYNNLNSITNAQINSSAAIAISKTALGTFTDWTTWSPTYGAGGSMTYTSVTTSIAEYCQIGKVVYFQIKAAGTTGGTASTYVRFTLPIAPTNTANDDVSGGCFIDLGGSAAESAFFSYGNTDAAIRVFRGDLSNWTLGTVRGIRVQGFYRVS